MPMRAEKNSPLLSDNIAQILLKDFIAPQMNKGNREDALVFLYANQAGKLPALDCMRLIRDGSGYSGY